MEPVNLTSVAPIVDPSVKDMTDRELAEETVLLLRQQREVVTGLIEALMASPLGAMLGKGANPLSFLGG